MLAPCLRPGAALVALKPCARVDALPLAMCGCAGVGALPDTMCESCRTSLGYVRELSHLSHVWVLAPCLRPCAGVIALP